MLASCWYLQSLPGKSTYVPGRGGPDLTGTGNGVISEMAAVITTAL